MSSLSSIVPGSRLLMRALQLCLNTAGRHLPASAAVSWNDSFLRDLRWWSIESHLTVGLSVDLPSLELALYTDASDCGWDALLLDDHLSGLWSPSCSSFSINHRGLLAVLYGVQGFLPVLQGRSASLFANTTTALSYLRKQGGTHSATLNVVAQTILWLCERHRVRLVPQFIPGTLNVLADSLSRRSQVLGSEWTLCHQAFRNLLRLWPATIDLFATAMTGPSARVLCADVRPSVSGHGRHDAVVGWPSGLCPSSLRPSALYAVRQSRGLELTLVAPFWPQHPWFPDLLELLVVVPVSLPQRKDLFRQPHFHRFHQNLRVLWLTAFRISSDPHVPSASLRQWLVNLPAAGDVPPE